MVDGDADVVGLGGGHGRRRPLAAGLAMACGLSLATALIGTARAQTPGGTTANSATQTPSSETSTALEEVTVTARRRSENIGNVPISISAFDPTELSERGIRTESELQESVPGLIVRTTAVSTQQNYSIRGQSIDAFTGSSPAVLGYVNDVEANAGAPTTFFDLSSVQVLKGPQGTLFGRNTTGGAVLFTTAEPSDSFGGFATLRAGNLGLKETEGAVDLPLSGRVLLRLAGDYYDRDGYQHDIATGQEYGGMVRRSGRATLVLKPIDGLQSKTVAEYATTLGRPVINNLYSYYPCGSPGLVSTAACLFSPALDTVVGVPGAWTAYLAAHPGANPLGIPGAYALQKQLGIRGVDSLQPNSIEQQNGSLTNTTTYDISAAVQLKNILGVSRSYVDFIADQAGVPFGLSVDYNTASGNLGNKTTLRNFSEEVQLLGKSFDSRLDYVAGLYYASDRHKEDDDLTYFDVSPIIAPSPSTFIFESTSRSEAVYAQGTYDLSSWTGVDGLKATGGVRYTWERDGLSYPVDQYALLSGQPAESADFSAPSWLLGIDYQLSPGLLVYVAQRGSWRSGGFNGYSPSNPTTAQYDGNKFLPEKTHDVEVGTKYCGDLAGLPAAVNVALYSQWITDIQRVIYSFAGPNASAFTANIPAGQVRGIEIDGEISPASWLTLGVTGAYTDAFYTNGVGVAYGGGVLHYGPVGDVSRLAGGVFARIGLSTPKSLGDMSVRADLYAQSYEYFANLNATLTPDTKLPGYSLLDLRYDWHDVVGTRLGLAAFAKNVLNRAYYTGGESFGVDFGTNDAAPGEPRTYGAEVSYRF